MSVLKWPSNQYWPRVANKYNITYHDEILSEEEYIDFQLNTPSNTSVQDVIDREDEVYQNYLKVLRNRDDLQLWIQKDDWNIFFL